MWLTLTDRWQDLRDGARQQWPELTDEDLAKIRGDKQRLIDAVRVRYHLDAEEAEYQVDEWEMRTRNR